MRKFTFALMALALVFSGFVAINAQTTGSISGTITDPNGAVVPGATVTLVNDATGVKQRVTTNNAGIFNFTTLQPGTYSVTVEGSGFKKTVAPDVAVEVSKQTQLSIALEVGLSGETVTVTGAQEVVNTSSPTLTNVINTRQVTDLPLPTRNPLDLAALQAGIAVVGDDTRGSTVGGLRQTATYVTQDGINVMDNFVKTSSFFAINAPSLNSTSEFSITTGTVGSEAGRGVAQVNSVTKGGTNDFHGSAFYLHRNDALNSTKFFNNFNGTPKDVLRQHFFGFDIGGPVYFLGFGEGAPAIWDGHDKAFFYFSYEGFRENFQATRNRPVLTGDARNGTFRYNSSGGVQTVNLLSVGNVSTLNPIVATLFAQSPLPNNTNCSGQDGFNIACYQFVVTGTDPNDKYVARYDHQLVKESRFGSHKFEFVFNRAKFLLRPDTFNVLEAPLPGGINAFQASKRYLVTGALVSNFGSSITNVFRYGRQWAPVQFLRDSQPSAPFIIFPVLPGTNNVSLTSPDNTFLSQGRNTVVDQYTDNVSWAKGNHLFRFGGDYQKIFADTFNDAGINQTITLGTNSSNSSGIVLSELPGGAQTDLDRANVVYSTIVGNLASSSRTFNVTSTTSGFVPGATRSRIFREQDLAFYGQDQWRMKSNLTLNLGLRWEFLGVPTIPNGLSIQVTDPNSIFGISGPGNLFNPNAPTGASPAVAVLDFVSGGTGKKLYKDDWDNFAPFIGLAWSPGYEKGFLHTLFGSPGKSSIRLGYAISYLHDGFTVISNALGTGTTNPGLIQTASTTTPTGVLTAAGVPLTLQPFAIPITDRTNFLANPGNGNTTLGNGLWAIDPNLKIPYVQQWNVGFEREIFPNTALEVRYVGNHALKVWRTNDFNEVNIFENGFLPEFLRAQVNLSANEAGFAAGDVNRRFCPGFVNPVTNACQTSSTNTTPVTRIPRFDFLGAGTGTTALPILSAFFNGVAMTNAFASSTFVSNLTGNNVGTMAATLAFSNTYRAARENPANGIPANFFVVNPNAAFARLLTNDSSSNYHALEIELRRRFSGGLQFQADYTFSKALTDAAPAQGNNQSDLVSFRTLRNKKLDFQRANGDQTHRFVANAIYELPFGKGRYWFSGAHGFVDKLIGGWSIGSIVVWATRPPWYVVSNRNTFNSFNPALNPAQLIGISFEEFKKNVGLFKDPRGVFFINPALLDITVNPVTGHVATSRLKAGLIGAPTPGTFGNFPLNSLDGPTYFNWDASVTKRLKIGERLSLELKTTFINALNHSNFIFANQTFDSTTFGVITQGPGTTGAGTERIIHFTGSIRF